MVVKEIQAVLKAHVGKPGEGVFKLSQDAGVAFETARRTVQGIGNPTVSTTNALLVAAGHKLKVVALEEPEAQPQASA
ncbi:hypothetical protein [Deinococcus ruber]|uniref:Uncharacterized protein n=1 Tax=Deinococcus ruber TaxID=1848197 RepID=A0A918C029_9DEIO|nr:hypothetical protein [Deinococcus ruber]GGR00063.1 hypothetical protein GCM10008957_10940 [Deinococcus ruber]